MANYGRQVIARCHIFSRYEGDDEALRIAERIIALLDQASLTVAGYTTVICEYLTGRVLVVAKDKVETRHLPVEFRVSVHGSPTPSSAVRPIQEAFFGVLSVDATLGTLLAGGDGVINDEPENQRYPFVLISTAHEKPWNTMGGA